MACCAAACTPLSTAPPPPANPEKHLIFWLANHAYNAMRRYWRKEKQYYQVAVSMVVEDETGEEQEMEFPDETAHAAVLEVLDRVFSAQALERLSPHLDARDWAILHGLAEGKTQKEVAQELGLAQSSVSERLCRIRRRARAILPDLFGESR